MQNREQIAIEQSISFGGGSSSRSPSPPPQPRRSRSRSPHHTAIAYRHQHSHSHSNSNSHSYQPSESETDHGLLGAGLAPPPAAPHGPRSPAQLSLHSRTPSPTPRLDLYVYSNNGSVNGQWNEYTDDVSVSEVRAGEEEEGEFTPVKPSAKALGKKRAVEPEPPASGHGCAFSVSSIGGTVADTTL